jgi:phosphomannomutase
VDGRLVEGYLDSVDLQRPPGPADRDFPIVYTPLHGVGGALALRALERAGFGHVHVVGEQAEPDGDFPTVDFPNPEEPGALDLALALAESTQAELVLANDPDADRLAVAARSAPAAERGSGRLVTLSGNQIGVLLADFLLSRAPEGQRSLVVWSIVSSPLLASVAASYGARAERTLTGFKWISLAGLELEAREGLRFVLGYEEALGFALGRDVRDKDGISAAVVFAELAAQARARGENVLDQLERIYRRHGLWASAQKSVVRSGPSGVAALARAVDRFAAEPPATVGGHAVSAVRDYRQGASERAPWLGKTALVELELGAAGRVLLRPSGTEPKLKIYVDLCENPGAAASLWEAEARLANEARAVSEAAAAIIDGLVHGS